MIQFKTKSGEILMGRMVRSYGAFEGDTRYIFQVDNGREYRCIKNSDGEYEEYVA